MAAITRLGAHGGPRSLYGSFADKSGAEAPVVVAKVQFGKTFYAGYDYKRRLHAMLVAKIAREDEEFIIILSIIGKYFL